MSRKNPRQVGNLEEHSGNRFISSIAERSDMSLLWQIERHLKETGTPPTLFGRRAVRDPRLVHDLRRGRSEEHTSELQSLMRISYAVFCLKKKKKKHQL